MTPQTPQAPLPMQTFRRLPTYYNLLLQLQQQHQEYVAAPAIAGALGLNEVQVRKDLASVSQSPGKPRRGFLVSALLRDMAGCLGYNNREDAILVGAGQLGRALLGYQGFAQQGVRIVAAFDTAPASPAAGSAANIFPMEKLPSLCRRLGVHIGIVTVPAAAAQSVCDELVRCGILAIWNFAPVHLAVPAGVLVQNENMAASLALLSRHLGKKMQAQGEQA